MRIVQASFFWKNDKQDGLGFTLRGPEFTPENLTMMFSGENVSRYFRQSDAELGSGVVACYLAQLEDIAEETRVRTPQLRTVVLAALNIMYLAERGFIPNDEFNGPLFVYEKT